MDQEPVADLNQSNPFKFSHEDSNSPAQILVSLKIKIIPENNCQISPIVIPKNSIQSELSRPFPLSYAAFQYQLRLIGFHHNQHCLYYQSNKNPDDHISIIGQDHWETAIHTLGLASSTGVVELHIRNSKG
jgi:hypothetical protein